MYRIVILLDFSALCLVVVDRHLVKTVHVTLGRYGCPGPVPYGRSRLEDSRDGPSTCEYSLVRQAQLNDMEVHLRVAITVHGHAQ